MRSLLMSIKTAASSTADVVADVVVGGRVPTFNELKGIEKKRREILKRSSLPLLRILFFWDGTCNSILFQDPLFWITLTLYMAVRLQARVMKIENISNSDIGIIGGFLSFFLVFFVIQSNTRFNLMYEKSMSCEGRIFDVATMAKASLPREHGLRLVRYMNAAHLAGYIGLSETYTVNNFFNNLNKSFKLLTRDEVKRMRIIDMDSGGSCYREIVAWCMMEIENARKAKIIDGRIAADFRERILMFRGSIGALYDFQDQPISFFYVHFLSLLSAVYLPLFAITAAYNVNDSGTGSLALDILSGLIVLLQIIFVIGLRVLGLRMSDPYGEDLEDLSVMHYIEFTWRMSNRILMSSIPAEINREGEERMVRRREPIGDAWEDSDEEEQDRSMNQHSASLKKLDESQSSLPTVRTSIREQRASPKKPDDSPTKPDSPKKPDDSPKKPNELPSSQSVRTLILDDSDKEQDSSLTIGLGTPTTDYLR